MQNSSYAAKAVADGPATLAPPSFDGHGWLVVINLAVMTAVCVLALMFFVDAVRAIRRNWGKDLVTHPVTIWRIAGMFFAMGLAIRCGAEALSLWNWDPRDPLATGWWLVAKRFADPVAAVCGATGLGVLYLSARGMVVQLRQQPFPVDMWSSLPMLKRPGWIIAVWLVAAIGVVSTR